MSSFSIIDDDKISKNYKVEFVSIFAISKSSWNNSLKSKGFNIVYPNQKVLFTGQLSGFKTNIIGGSNIENGRVEVKIRFNRNGETDYIYEIMNFVMTPLPFQIHFVFPINFVKTFTQTGLYDVYIESTSFSSGLSTQDIISPSLSALGPRDIFYLNASLYDIDNTGIFF